MKCPICYGKTAVCNVIWKKKTKQYIRYRRCLGCNYYFMTEEVFYKTTKRKLRKKIENESINNDTT